MARKNKSELVKTLEAQNAPPAYDLEAHQRHLERIDAEHLNRAKQFLADKGLYRRDGESVESWRKRTLEWIKQQSQGWKRFGENGIESEERT